MAASGERPVLQALPGGASRREVLKTTGLRTERGLRGRGSPYALRHTYATFGIAAGVSLFELARFMGTSVEQIGKTYGHLLSDALDRTRQALDSFADGRREAAMIEGNQ